MPTVSEFMLDRLHAWGVRRIYGYPGDGINGIVGALEDRQDELRFLRAPHEEMAAFMACAHAKFTGEVGVCLATSGPGAIHLLNGLYDAKKDHMPVVAIVGQQATTALGSDYQQEVDLISLFKDVAHNYVHMVTHPSTIRTLVDRALRIAIAERCVTCIIIPNDLQTVDYEDAPRQHGTSYSGVGYRAPQIIPYDADLRSAAALLNEGERVAMLVGAGALGAGQEVFEVADLLGAGVAKALLGKAALPDDLPFVTGAIGLLGTEPSWDLMMDCDTLLIVGSSFPYSEFLPELGQARAVQIDIKARMLSLRYPVDVPLQGDAGPTLRALIPMLQRKQDRAWRTRIEDKVTSWWDKLDARAHETADPINPQRLFWEISPLLPDDAILSADSGSAANWFARDLKVRAGMKASLSGGLATMCPGVPYALAAKFCFPDRPSIAFVGDGAMQMLGNNGLIMVGEHWQEWADPRLVVVVINNGDLNQVTWEQRVMEGDPKFPTSQDVSNFDYAAYARLCGLAGVRVTTPEEIVPAWHQAMQAGRPCVIDVLTDPSVPPLPPHISFEQARHFMLSIAKGDPNAGSMMKQSLKDMFARVLPGSRS